MKTVVLADGHPAMLHCLRGLVEAAGGMELVAETAYGEEVMTLAKKEAPDLVVLALNLLGETDGITVCQCLKTLPRPPKVLVFTAYNFDDDVASCLLAGADSYLHKRCGCEEVLDAMKRTAEGDRVWKTGGRVGDPRFHIKTSTQGVKLSAKEREVAALMVRRMSNEEIAKKLFVSVCTVKSHVRSILRKLGLKHRWELY